MRPLNPEAPAFVPLASSPGALSSVDDEPEAAISQEELDELEAVEDWVATMAEIEESETAFLIDLALDLAPSNRVAEAERSSCAASGEEGHAKH